MNISKICIACTSPAVLMCSRCSDYYCSIECQRSDWPNHRHLCIRMPPLTTIDVLGHRLSTTLRMSNSKVENGVASNSLNSSDSIPTLTAKNSGSQPSMKQAEEKVASPKEIAKVTEKKQQETPKKDVPEPKKQLIAETVKNPAQALNIPSFPRTFKPIQVASEPKKPERVMVKDLKHRAWPNTKNVRVKLICMLQEQTFVLREDNVALDRSYEDIAGALAKYVAKNKKERNQYQPVKDEMVIAEFEGEWYRAHVLGPDSDTKGFIVKYIEYGNIEVKEHSLIIPATEELKFEITTRDFIIENFNEDTITPKQMEIFHSGSFTITDIRKADNHVWTCSIYGF